MFIVLLKFSTEKEKAGKLMGGHNDWIQQGFDQGVFLMAGGLKPSLGGALLAHNTTLDELKSRVELDPFVAQGVVHAEIHEIAPSRTERRLDFLRA
jgi:uncharacterized protein YciI